MKQRDFHDHRRSPAGILRNATRRRKFRADPAAPQPRARGYASGLAGMVGGEDPTPLNQS